MTWKGLGILGAAIGLVVLAVVGLAQLTVPDVPTFAEDLAGATETPEGGLDFVPTAIGGELVISGTSEGTISLDRQVEGPNFGLSDGQSRVFFDQDPFSISQLYFEDLAFFPEPEECGFTQGQHNEDAGLIAVQISCPELDDVRDNGTVSVEGYAALHANLVIEVDLPDIGGTLMVGEETWEIVDPVLIVAPGFRGDPMTGLGFALNPEEPGKGLRLSYDSETGVLSPSTLIYDEIAHELNSATCTITDETLLVVNPEAEINELTIDCENVDTPGVGTIEIEGTVVYQKLYGLD